MAQRMIINMKTNKKGKENNRKKQKGNAMHVLF